MSASDSLRFRDHVSEMLRLLGEDPQREGLLKTPSASRRRCSS